MLNFLVKKEILELANDIEHNIEDWKQAQHYIVNEKSNIKIWTSNGIWFIDFYPSCSAFNILEKIIIKRAIIKNNCNQVLKYQ